MDWNFDAFHPRGTEEIFQALEDNQVALSTMKASRFVKAFEKEVDHWERCLSLILEVVEMVLTVQRQWMYLEVRTHSGSFLGAGPTSRSSSQPCFPTSQVLLPSSLEHNSDDLSRSLPSLKVLFSFRFSSQTQGSGLPTPTFLPERGHFALWF